MGLFSKLLKKDTSTRKLRNAEITVVNNERLTENGARIHFEIPAEFKELYQYTPGQYLTVHVDINGEKLNRSYSICSGPNETLAIAVKAIPSGQVSNYLVNQLQNGTKLTVDFPIGNFILKPEDKHLVCFAAGSGITPIIAMAKHLNSDQTMKLFYGNGARSSSFFLSEISELKQVQSTLLFSREEVPGSISGRLDKKNVSELIKADLSILRADGFYICGPEEMILGIQEVLHVFGVPDSKIHFELFTTPVLMKQPETTVTSGFSGDAAVSAVLDGEITKITLNTSGKTILEALDEAGMDVPYSCKGGVCCTCKAKILEGSATMNINYALTDEEVKDGYILTCQAHPTSETLKLDFDV